MLPLEALPDVTGTPNAATIFSYLKTLLTLISGEVNFSELERVVVTAEVMSPGWSSALNGIKSNETTIFPDALTRPIGVYLIGVVAKLVGVTLA